MSEIEALASRIRQNKDLLRAMGGIPAANHTEREPMPKDTTTQAKRAAPTKEILDTSKAVAAQAHSLTANVTKRFSRMPQGAARLAIKGTGVPLKALSTAGDLALIAEGASEGYEAAKAFMDQKRIADYNAKNYGNIDLATATRRKRTGRR